MSNIQPLQVPAHIAARIQARKAGGAKSTIMDAIGSGGLSYPRISIRGGRYRLVEEGVETVVGIEMDVIIVGANPKVSKIWFSKPYAGEANVQPDCYSDDGVTPAADAKQRVSANCATCPNNVLGSKVTPTGAKSKLCADQRHLAVVPAVDPSKVYGLTVPVSGMKGLREYFKDLDNYGLVVEDVVTKLKFDDTAEYPKMVFTQAPNGFVPESAMPMVAQVMASDEVKVATRTMAAPAASALPPAAPAAPTLTVVQSAPATAPAPAAPNPFANMGSATPMPAAPVATAETVQHVQTAQPAPPPPPVSAPVTAGSEALASKLDALFG